MQFKIRNAITPFGYLWFALVRPIIPLGFFGSIIGAILGGRRRRQEAAAAARARAAAERAARLEHERRMEALRAAAAQRKALMRAVVPLGIAALGIIFLIKRKK